MPTSTMHDLRSVAAEFLRPLHKTLPNGMLSCTLNSPIVLELINDPLVIPRSLRTTGDFNECEHTREPDHRLAATPWHAYIPVDDSFPPNDVKSWVFQDLIPPLELLAPTFGPGGRITSSFLRKVENIVGDIIRWLPTVYAICGPSCPILTLQLSDLEPLKSFCGSYNDASTVLWAVRRSVLIAWGYIIYHLSITQDWQKHTVLDKDFVSEIISSGLLNLPRRGLIIDAQDPPPFSDVLLYLRHKVPVFYYWKPGCVRWLNPAVTHSVGLFPESSGSVLVYDDGVDGQEVVPEDHPLLNALESASPHSPTPSHPSSPISSLPFKSVPSAHIINHFETTVAIDDDKTQWILRAFNMPHTSFNDSFRTPRVPLPDRLTFITSGELAVSKRTEVRLRLWRTQYPTIPLWFFAYHCLSCGLDWRVFTQLSDLSHSALGPPPPKPAYLQADPRQLTKGTSLLVDYVRRVETLLQQPHARRFLTMGGIVWRIALHYGPVGFFAMAISEPSIDVALHLHFDEGGDRTTVDDRVSKAEISLLLGMTENGSIWPTLDIWERNEHWSGEWNTKAERWFQSRIRQIETGSSFSLLTRKQWKAIIRRHTAAAFSNSRTVGTEAHAMQVCLELDELFPPPESMTYL